MEKLGVDLIKKVAKNLIETGREIQSDYSDKKISYVEIIGLADNVFAIAGNITKWEEIKNQVLDIDSQEGIELVDYIVSLGIGAGEAAEIAKHAINIIEAGLNLWKSDIKPILDIIKKK